MDKYELKVSLDEIDRLISERRFGQAASVADTIDWTRMKSVHVLCRISDLYKINKRYKDSRDLMQMAYERNPAGRKIIYSLCELELKLNNYIHALQLYNAFINVAPRDSDRFLLQYKLYKKQDVNVFEQISVLEEFLQHDFRERWAYELATLYLRAGEEQRCIRQCDEIVAYFGDGRFVIRALELKKSLTRLTPQQEERLEILKSGGTITPPAPAPDQAEDQTPSGQTDPGAETEDRTSSGQTDPDQAEDQTPSGQTDPEAETEGRTSSGQTDPDRDEPDGTISEEAESAGKNSRDYDLQSTAKVVIDARRAMPNGLGGHAAPSQEKEAALPGTDGEKTDAEETDSLPSATPEEYTDALLRDVKMEETIARGMREIGDYDDVLAQETSGQFAMVMEEESREDPQVEGQLDLAQIMSEWEKIRRDSENERLAQARRRVMERSDAAKRELYGDGYASSPAGAAAGDAGNTDAGDAMEDDFGFREAGELKSANRSAEPDGAKETTRSWKKEDVEKGLRSRRR